MMMITTLKTRTLNYIVQGTVKNKIQGNVKTYMMNMKDKYERSTK